MKPLSLFLAFVLILIPTTVNANDFYLDPNQPIIDNVDVSAFRYHLLTSFLQVQSPTTVKLSLPANTPSPVVVVDNRTVTIIPSLIKNEAISPSFIVTDASTGSTISEVADQNPKTYYEISHNTVASWDFSFVKPQPIQGINFHLAQNSRTPDVVSITGTTDQGDFVTILNSIPFTSNITFPAQTLTGIKVSVTLSQPVRINDFSIDYAASPSTQAFLYFLAEPDHEYLIFTHPDRPIRRDLPESGSFDDAKDPIFMTATQTANPVFRPSDADQDGIADISDNCPLAVNLKQEDDNHNGIGNVCEDTDFDSIIDSRDNCPLRPNANQADLDRDNLGDVCDSLDNRLTEQYPFLPWLALILVGGVIAILFYRLAKSNALSENPDNQLG